MDAGRELDVLVAEKVIGVKIEPEESIPIPFRDRYPYYSTDIAAAWDVIDKLRCNLKMTWEREDQIYVELRFICKDASMCSILSATGNTFPHAICLAALKAVGVEN